MVHFVGLYCKILFNITLSSTSRSSKWFLSLRFPHLNNPLTSPFPHTKYANIPNTIFT